MSATSFLNSRSSVFEGVLRETNALLEQHWFVSFEAMELVSSNTDSCYLSSLREVGGDLCLGMSGLTNSRYVRIHPPKQC
jgi:hypothetical protein